jgi:hypothetical protein
MADITTVEGLRILFDPAAIAAIAGSDGQTGATGAVIYGLGPEGLTVGESTAALIKRLSLASSLAKLTRPDGSPIWINGKSVSVARQPSPGEYQAQVQSVIFAGAIKQAVREMLDDVRQAIDRAGANL